MLGNLLSGSDQQYVAMKDEAGTWRILNTWHEELKHLNVDDEVSDKSEAVTVLSEGQFIALVKEAASLGVLANVSVGGDTTKLEEELSTKEDEVHELKESVSSLKHEVSQRTIALETKSPHSEEYDLKEKAMDSILKLVSLQDVTNLGRE